MKLIQDSASSLPQEPGYSRHRWLKKLAQTAVSQTGLTIIVGIVCFLLVSVGASLPFFSASPYIDENGNSVQDIYADTQLDVEDKDETLRKIDRARQSVPITYKDQM